MLALVAGKRFAYADKKPKPTESGKKQEYEWDLSQFEFEKGERIAIAEDVFNNFQNTDNTLAKIAVTGGFRGLPVIPASPAVSYTHLTLPTKRIV